jgi:hypothetical protein
MMPAFLQVFTLGLAFGRVADALVQDRAATSLEYDYVRTSSAELSTVTVSYIDS